MDETSLLALAIFVIGSLIFQSYLSVTHTHRVLLLEKKIPIKDLAEETLKNSILELQDSFIDLHTVFSIAPIGLAIAEVANDSISFVNYNATTETMLQLSSPTHQLWDAAADCLFWMEKYYSSLQSQAPIVFEFVHNGRLLSIHLMATPKTSPLHKHTFSFAMQDITEQKQQRELHAELELALQGLHGAFLDWNLVTGDIVITPMYGKTMLGLKVSTSYSLAAWLEKMHKGERNRFVQALNGLMQGKTGYELPYRVLNANSQWEWVYNKASVVKSNMQGKPLRASGFLMNVNGIGEDLEEMHHLSNELQTLTTLANIGVMRTDAQGTCIVANDHWLDLHSQSKKRFKLADVSITENVSEEDKAKVSSKWNSFLSQHSHLDVVYRVKDKGCETSLRRSVGIARQESNGVLKQLTVFTLPLRISVLCKSTEAVPSVHRRDRSFSPTSQALHKIRKQCCLTLNLTSSSPSTHLPPNSNSTSPPPIPIPEVGPESPSYFNLVFPTTASPSSSNPS